MDPSSASYFPSVFCHSHNKSNRGRNTLRSRSAIPNDQEGDHKPKVKRKLKMVCQFYYYMVFRGLILFKIEKKREREIVIKFKGKINHTI